MYQAQKAKFHVRRWLTTDWLAENQETSVIRVITDEDLVDVEGNNIGKLSGVQSMREWQARSAIIRTAKSSK